MVKSKSWSAVSEQEINSTVADMKAELFALKCEYKFAKKIEQPHRLRTIRRDIARALTELQRRKTDVASIPKE